jgi:START domain
MKFVLMTFLLICNMNYSFAADWYLEKNKDGIKVYTRNVSGSNVKEYKAIANVKADRLAIARVLTRVGDLQNWMPNVEKSKMVKKTGSSSIIGYYTVDLSWPIENRDIVLDLWVETDNDKGVTYIKMKENLTAYAEVEGYTRIKKASGFYKLTKNGDSTDLVYQFHSEPGGSLPTSIINMFIVDGPYDIIQALRKKVE